MSSKVCGQAPHATRTGDVVRIQMVLKLLSTGFGRIFPTDIPEELEGVVEGL